MDVSSRAANGSDEGCGLLKAPTSRLISPYQAAQSASHESFESSAESPADWALVITSLVVRGRTETRELARLVYDAKKKLLRGQWTELWRSPGIPFSKRKAEMLAAIGQGLGALNPQTFAHLPVGWSILYQLSRLNLEVLHRHIHDGLIHPNLTLAEAKSLVAAFNGRAKNENSQRPKIKQRLRRFVEFVHETIEKWSPEERSLAHIELTALLDEIGNSAKGDTPNAQTFAHIRSRFFRDRHLSSKTL